MLLSYEEKLELYSKLNKEELIRMLINAETKLYTNTNFIKDEIITRHFNEYKPIISKEEGSKI